MGFNPHKKFANVLCSFAMAIQIGLKDAPSSSYHRNDKIRALSSGNCSCTSPMFCAFNLLPDPDENWSESYQARNTTWKDEILLPLR